MVENDIDSWHILISKYERKWGRVPIFFCEQFLAKPAVLLAHFTIELAE